MFMSSSSSSLPAQLFRILRSEKWNLQTSGCCWTTNPLIPKHWPCLGGEIKQNLVGQRSHNSVFTECATDWTQGIIHANWMCALDDNRKFPRYDLWDNIISSIHMAILQECRFSPWKITMTLHLKVRFKLKHDYKMTTLLTSDLCNINLCFLFLSRPSPIMTKNSPGPSHVSNITN